MKLVKSFAGALLVSVWLLVHAIFVVNGSILLQFKKETRDVQQLIPIKLRKCCCQGYLRFSRSKAATDQMVSAIEIGRSCASCTV